MRIVADENIPALQEYFSVFGDVVAVNGRALQAEQVADADVLLVRSVTPVNADLLAGSPVRFVGTCTIGTDHLDTAYLRDAGVSYASAPGCNAGGVVQYVLTALSQLRENWRSSKVGIVGCGNVGGRLYRTLRQLGVDCVGYDPFLASSSDLQLVSFEEVLQADILCLHAPYTTEGTYPTRHMFNAAALAQLRPGALLLNAGRGGVIDNAALLARLQAGADLEVVLDVWENEPSINADLARCVAVGTPHIAGYSDEGRMNGSIMICRALAQFLGWSDEQIEAHLQAVSVRSGNTGGSISAASVKEALISAYDIWADHQRFMAAVNDDAPLGPAFDRLRKHYPGRREPSYYTVAVPDANAALEGELRAAGFRLVGRS
jgi:erythronate-4-phosphate dehydrogenase